MDSGHITRAKLKLIPHSFERGYQWVFLSVSRHRVNLPCLPISSFSRRAKHLTVGSPWPGTTGFLSPLTLGASYRHSGDKEGICIATWFSFTIVHRQTHKQQRHITSSLVISDVSVAINIILIILLHRQRNLYFGHLCSPLKNVDRAC